MSAKDDMNRAGKNLERAGEHTGEAARHTKEAMEAGASGTVERAREAARETGRKVGDVARGIRQAEPDRDLERRAGDATKNAVHRAGDAIQRAGGPIGRGAEAAAELSGSAISAASGVLGSVVGKIAGRAGGWWSSAAETMTEMPEAERDACRTHFESAPNREADLTFDEALPGYSLGYLAAENPGYRGRSFDEIEPDLRHGFGSDDAAYDDFRDFTRFGYERGSNRR